MLNLGTSWPHRGQATSGGGVFLKNEVIGVVTLVDDLSLWFPFFLHLDRDKRFLGLFLSLMLEGGRRPTAWSTNGEKRFKVTATWTCVPL